jgi:hypothetical protein
MISKTSICNTLHIFLALAVFSQPCLSVDTAPEAFQWEWSSSIQEATGALTECEFRNIDIINLTNYGTAPYYFIAYELGGFSTATFVGTDHSNLTWQVRYPVGTKLMLGMVDADGNSGGIADSYTVSSGQDASCLPPTPPSSQLIIKGNVSKTLSSCEPWGLRVSGGTPPYNITLVVYNIPSTNYTLSSGLDVLTYVNNGIYTGQMLAAVSDSIGQFGVTTSLIHTIGSASGCNGLQTTAGNSSEIPFYSNSSPSKRTTIIIAVCATIGGLLVITGATLFTLRKALARRMKDGQDTIPRVFDIQDKTEERRHVVSMESSSTNALDPPQSASYSGRVERHPINPNDLWQQPNTHPFRSFDLNPQGRENFATTSQNLSTSADLPLAPITLNTAHSNDEARNAIASDPHIRISPFAVQTQHLDPDTEPDIIIQHRDAGDLPPPYLDQLQSPLRDIPRGDVVADAVNANAYGQNHPERL